MPTIVKAIAVVLLCAFIIASNCSQALILSGRDARSLPAVPVKSRVPTRPDIKRDNVDNPNVIGLPNLSEVNFAAEWMRTFTEPSDPAPQNLNLGVINPFALVEALTNKTLDWTKPETAEIISDVLETDYAHLFDIKFGSPLYAGLKLNPTTKTVERMDASEVKILTSADRPTGPLNNIKQLGDLKTFGVGDLASLQVLKASIHNGKLELVLPAPPGLYKRISNTALTREIYDLVISKRGSGSSARFMPPGTTWLDKGDFFEDVTEFNDPIQGAVANCYLIAALSAVAWADPYDIIHRNRATGPGDTDRVNAIQFYSTNGRLNGPTGLVEVTDEILVSATPPHIPTYCRSNDRHEIWPSLYEKAFAKWVTGNTSDFPDITVTAFGDSVNAMAQLTGKKAYYYSTASLTPGQIFAILRAHSLSFKTIFPMIAATYATEVAGNLYSGTNIVANHAYAVLGWASFNGKDYIVLRNPWGNTEPNGPNTYQGVVSFFDNSFWRYIDTRANDGIFALEVSAFKTYYQTLGVVK